MLSPLSTASLPVTDDVVKDVTLATFVADVIEASRSCVVLVDFWATWCGPCKQLTPVLEKIARASNGTVRLAKIDIDRNQPIAQQMGVQSVPSVFAFSQGRPVDGFAGALSEAQVKAWLEPILKATGATGGADSKAALEAALKQATEFLAAKDIAAAHSVYTEILSIEPTCAAAYAGLARCLIDVGDIAKARQMIDSAPGDIAKDKTLIPVRSALELAEQASQVAGGETAALEAKVAQNPVDHQSRFNLAMAYYAAGKREEAVDHLLEIVRCARSWNEDAARKQLIKFFEVFGMTDPLTIDARKRLSSLLFS